MSRKRSRPGRPLEYAASVQPGLEEVSGHEIVSRLQDARVVESHRGWVVFRYPGNASDLLQLRTTEDVFCLLFHTKELPPARKSALALLSRMARNSRAWDRVWAQVRQQYEEAVTYRMVTDP